MFTCCVELQIMKYDLPAAIGSPTHWLPLNAN